MAKSFDEYYDRLPDEDKAEIQGHVQQMLAEMPLAELRQARNFTQKKIASNLDISQPSVAKMEKQTDMYISTARRYVEAMGGKLQIIATFPNGQVELNNFNELELQG